MNRKDVSYQNNTWGVVPGDSLMILWLFLEVMILLAPSPFQGALPQNGRTANKGNVGVLPREEADEPGNGMPPNELGRVLILEYHKLETVESRWSRSAHNFRKDLETLYRQGFRPIALNEFIDGKISIARGTHPLLITFDDSSPGQFRYLIREGRPVIDPDCAVGILANFHALHADFALRAVFFVLPEAAQPHKLFGQPDYETLKLRELVRMGFEIGNHTFWHANLKKYSSEIVQRQLALGAAAIQQRVPGYQVRALALPLGNYPADAALAVDGIFERIRYHHDAVLRAVGGPAFSPFHRHFDPFQLPRIQAVESELQYWWHYFEKNREELFTSDGDPETVSAPASQRPFYNSTRFPKLRFQTVEPEGNVKAGNKTKR